MFSWIPGLFKKKYKPSQELRAGVIPSLRLDVGGNSYIVEFPLKAIAKAQEKLGHGLMTFTSWLNLEPGELAVVLEAGLSTHHPDISEAEALAVCNGLTPEALDEVHCALCHLAYPKAMARFEELRAKLIENGGTLPNVPSGASL